MARLNWKATAEQFYANREKGIEDDLLFTPDWLDGSEDALESVFGMQDQLLLEGKCLPGCLVQASSTLFRRFGKDGIATFVYSEDRFFLRSPAQLVLLAQRVYDLKSAEPKNGEEAFLKHLLNSPEERFFALPLPDSLTGKHSAYVTLTVFPRDYLPHRRICGMMYPLAVIPDGMPDALPIPSKYWVSCGK